MRSENILIFFKRNTGIKNIRLIDGLTTCVVERNVQVEQIPVLYNVQRSSVAEPVLFWAAQYF